MFVWIIVYRDKRVQCLANPFVVLDSTRVVLQGRRHMLIFHDPLTMFA